MSELTHFILSVAACLALGVIMVKYGGWVIMALVIGLPLLEYLSRDRPS